MKYIIGIIGLFIIGALTLNLTKPEGAATGDVSDSELKIVTSIYPLAYLAEEIIGDKGSVNNIGENQDPHDFKPTAKDILAMQNADLVILQGAELEPWGEDIEHQLEKEGVNVLVVTENLDLYEAESEDEHTEHSEHAEESHDEHEEDHDDHGEEHEGDHEESHDDHEEDHHDEHNHGLFDPHTWLDLDLMTETATQIAEHVSKIDSENKVAYQANLSRIKDSLESLNDEYKNSLSSCTVKEVITSHDAFGYIGRNYNFEIHTISGFSTQDTPSSITLAKLKEEAEEGITTILLEQNSISAYGETLARETGLNTLPINPIVYNIPEGQDYQSMMLSNLETFKAALNCNE